MHYINWEKSSKLLLHCHEAKFILRMPAFKETLVNYNRKCEDLYYQQQWTLIKSIIWKINMLILDLGASVLGPWKANTASTPTHCQELSYDHSYGIVSLLMNHKASALKGHIVRKPNFINKALKTIPPP